tara:strand:- start:951 stop:1610 length:660 start_codon:yes stop_codon:yes gene_type:complete
MQASEALEKHAVEVAEKLSGGNSNNSLIHKYNLMSSWVDYMRDFISIPNVTSGHTPDILKMPAVTGPFVTDPATLAYLGACIVFGIRDNEGTYVTIGRVNRAVEATWKEKMHENINLRANVSGITSMRIGYGGGSYKYSIVITEQTDKYNGQPLLISPGLTFENDYVFETVRGGVTPSSFEGKVLTDEQISKFNSILEDIAIELKISYNKSSSSNTVSY